MTKHFHCPWKVRIPSIFKCLRARGSKTYKAKIESDLSIQSHTGRWSLSSPYQKVVHQVFSASWYQTGIRQIPVTGLSRQLALVLIVTCWKSSFILNRHDNCKDIWWITEEATFQTISRSDTMQVLTLTQTIYFKLFLLNFHIKCSDKEKRQHGDKRWTYKTAISCLSSVTYPGQLNVHAYTFLVSLVCYITQINVYVLLCGFYCRYSNSLLQTTNIENGPLETLNCPGVNVNLNVADGDVSCHFDWNRFSQGSVLLCRACHRKLFPGSWWPLEGQQQSRWVLQSQPWQPCVGHHLPTASQ